MNEPLFTFHNLPRFHPHKLILTLEAVGAAHAATSGGKTFQGFVSSPLVQAQKEGVVTRVTFLGHAAKLRTGDLNTRTPAMLPMAAMLEAPQKADALAEVAILQLRPDVDEVGCAEKLLNDPLIRSAARVPARYLCATPSSRPPGPAKMWNLNQIRWNKVPQKDKSAARIKVAVLDTGIDTSHPALPAVAAYHYEHPDVADSVSDRDLVGHGTHVAGTIAAKLDGADLSGICECDLHCWKIFSDEPEYIASRNSYWYIVDPAMYLDALRSCEEQKIDVINLSIGGTEPPSDVESARFESLVRQGAVIIAAMGNERGEGSPVSYPAAIQGVIAVGATDNRDTVADFSNAGKHIALSAPGVEIWSTLPTYAGQTGFRAIKKNGKVELDKAHPFERERDFAQWSGTSMSAPHVSAAAALLLARFGKKPPAFIKQQLMDNASKIAAMGAAKFSNDYGAGRLDLLDLLGLGSSPTTTPSTVTKKRSSKRKRKKG
jgi:Subtilase family